LTKKEGEKVKKKKPKSKGLAVTKKLDLAKLELYLRTIKLIIEIPLITTLLIISIDKILKFYPV